MNGTLIFGGTGSLGRKLIERFLPTASVAVYSRDEAKHWTLRNEFNSGKLAGRAGNLEFFVGDIRDPNRISDVLRQYRPSTIIIAAALKQVDTCELSPSESVMTNLLGTQHIIDTIRMATYPPATVLFVSTDKACAPVNVYGMSKALSERIVTSQARTGVASVRYLVVRYGNVLESRGSIIPLFKYQGENSQYLTVTDPDMTRFVMTLDDSVDLIEHTLNHGKSGETWIPRLPAMKIGHLAEMFSKRYGKPIKIVGLRPGEKIDEELINESESTRTRVADDGKHFIIKPSYEPGTADRFFYSSRQDVMRADQLEEHLQKLGILDASLSDFKGRSIEEIMR